MRLARDMICRGLASAVPLETQSVPGMLTAVCDVDYRYSASLPHPSAGRWRTLSTATTRAGRCCSAWRAAATGRTLRSNSSQTPGEQWLPGRRVQRHGFLSAVSRCRMSRLP